MLWVKRARQEHDVFVDALRERGVIVHLFGELLAETMAIAEARDWLLDRRVDDSVVGYDMVDEMRGWLDEMPADELASLLVGGIARAELPFQPGGLTGKTLLPQDFVLPPLPNQLFTRDSSCWIYRSVSVNAMYWPVRKPEAANVEAVYRFHPRFRDAGLTFVSPTIPAPALAWKVETSCRWVAAWCWSVWASAPRRRLSAGSPAACSPPARRHG